MTKDLTNSNIDRENILNNPYAIEKIQEFIGLKWIFFEEKYRFTKKQVADFYDVSEKTIERYLEQNEWELRKNGYEILTGKRLEQAKNVFGTDINVGTKTTVQWFFDFRSFLNIWMLLKESEKAQELRSKILDIVLDVIYQNTGWNTKYINQREENYLLAATRDISYRKEFTDALDMYIDMWQIKYARYTNAVYKCVFKENAQEYRKILQLSKSDNVRDTMYSEVLTIISSFEAWLAFELKEKSEELNRKLSPTEADELFVKYFKHPSHEPLLDDARTKMASRDSHFRDVLHEKLSEYIQSIPKEDFDKFLWEKSKTLIEQIAENQDIFLRLKNR